MIEVDLDARRIASAEKNYPRVRRLQQAEGRRAWLASADAFRTSTKRLLYSASPDERALLNRPLSQMRDAQKAVSSITR